MTLRGRRGQRTVQPPDRVPAVVLVDGDVDVETWALPCCRAPDLGALDRAVVGLEVVEVVARLALRARRRGWAMRLEAPPEVWDLLDLAGLRGLAAGRPLRVEPGRQSEGGEEVGVEEVVVPDDPIA